MPLRNWRPFLTDDVRSRFERYLDEIFESGVLTDGEFTRRMEKTVASMHGYKYAVAVASATDAMKIAMMYKRDVEGVRKIWMWAAGYPSSYIAAKEAGLDVEFVDVGSERIENFEESWPSVRTFFGGLVPSSLVFAPNVTGVVNVLNDCAHCFGVRELGESLCGSPAVISFHAVKIVTGGEGGILLTNSRGMNEYAREARRFGFKGREPFMRGTKSCMSEITAALILSMAEEIRDIVNEQRVVKEMYDELLGDLMYHARFDEDVIERWNCYEFAVVIPWGRRVVEHALNWDYGIQVRRSSVYSLPDMRIVDEKEKKDCPNARFWQESYVCLPSGYGFRDEDAKFVAKALKEIVERFRLKEEKK